MFLGKATYSLYTITFTAVIVLQYTVSIRNVNSFSVIRRAQFSQWETQHKLTLCVMLL